MKITTQANRIDLLDERFYQVGTDSEGIPIYYPSVTWILDCLPKGAGFEQWLKDVGNNAAVVAARAAESGTLVHDAIAQMLKGINMSWSNLIQADMKYHGNTWTLEEWKMLLRFHEFWMRHNCQLIASEVVLTAHEGYAGTADIICLINDECWLIDIKTGNDIYDSAYLQIAAYANAWNQQYSEMPVTRVGVLHLRAKTRGESKGKIQGEGWKLDQPAEDITYLFENFMSVFEVFRFVNRGRKLEPIINSLPVEISLNNQSHADKQELQ